MQNEVRVFTDPDEIEFEYQRECKLLAEYFLKSASAMQEASWGGELYSYIRHHDPSEPAENLLYHNYLIDYCSRPGKKDKGVIELLSAIQTRLDFAEEYRDMINDRDPRPWYEAVKWKDEIDRECQLLNHAGSLLVPPQ